MTKKVELLAPAGNYEGLMGALAAGADAVYLGGQQFGARAYAENFDEKTLIKGMDFAHLQGRKVYLTVNTLVKEREFGDLFPYITPLYENGLDGVIVQDVGVLAGIQERFPELPVHASTQMNVTHAYGAAFLKKCGVSRIVLARELSLEEIRRIREQTEIELEVFIHGAMCYSYSGQCLFSSILGGRSGNRGRCAQPCRLPYGKNREEYLLSMKDISTIEILPELIEAGIHSFKIEGRMKKPEYTAGVSAIYRKYIDAYYENGKEGYQVSEEDRRYLQSLYLRSKTGTGYCHRHNDREMMTLGTPGYGGSDGQLLKEIRNQYISSPNQTGIRGQGTFVSGQPAELSLSCFGMSVCTKGDMVVPAKSAPMTAPVIEKQLRKSGNTPFFFQTLQLTVGKDIFMPVKMLNELRRQAFLCLEEALLQPFRRKAPVPKRKDSLPETRDQVGSQRGGASGHNPWLHAYVTTREQLESAVLYGSRLSGTKALPSSELRIYMSVDLWEKNKKLEKPKGQQWFAVLPRILRFRDEKYLPGYQAILQEDRCDGVLISNMESYEWLQHIGYTKKTVSDACLYLWNQKAGDFWRKRVSESLLPLELNRHEVKDILKTEEEGNFIFQVYGRLPMMVSANCIRKTKGSCGEGSFLSLQDRYGKQFPVLQDCRHCYNIIYNSLPLSLHEYLHQEYFPKINAFRLDFTNETERETTDILFFFESLLTEPGPYPAPPYREYTTGHFKRGVE